MLTRLTFSWAHMCQFGPFFFVRCSCISDAQTNRSFSSEHLITIERYDYNWCAFQANYPCGTYQWSRKILFRDTFLICAICRQNKVESNADTTTFLTKRTLEWKFLCQQSSFKETADVPYPCKVFSKTKTTGLLVYYCAKCCKRITRSLLQPRYSAAGCCINITTCRF